MSELTTEPNRSKDGVAPSPAARRGPHPIRWWVLGMGSLLLVGFVIALASQLGKDPSVVPSPLLNKPVPEFDLARLDGGRIRSADLRGKPYVINFWASWCVPCRREAPLLESFSRRWQGAGVALVGILYDDSPASARSFNREFGATWPTALDPDGGVALQFGVAGVPETFIVDANGIIWAKLVGQVGPTTLDDLMRRLSTGGAPVSSRNNQYRQAP